VRRDAAIILGLGGGLGAGAYGVLRLASYRAQLWLCLTIGLVLVAGWRLLLAAMPPGDLADAFMRAEAEPGGGFDSLSALEHRLSWGSVDVERYEARVRPQLARLAAERLRQRHGVDFVSQPEVARRMVGEPLWQLMTGPPNPAPPNRSRLDELLTAIERI
jgi:hypothetical protein